MKNIKIKEMTLSYFKGQNAHHAFGDTNMASGRNGSGKSTIIAAWNWLICGQTKADVVANDNLFDNRQSITPDTPTASVEVVIDIDGVEYRLKRTATASFSRKRGTSETIKNPSDTYKYYVDAVEYNATEYKDWLSVNICQDDMLKYVLDGSFFVGLVFSDKKRARAIIEKTVGTVERSEMKGNYSDIDELLQKMTPDQIEEQSKNLSKNIDARLNEIPTVISQKEGEIAEISQTNFNAVQNEIDTLEAEQKSIEEKIFDYSARMKPLLEAKAKAEEDKRMKQEVYDKAKRIYQQSWIDKDNELVKQISEAEATNAKSDRDTLDIRNAIESAQKSIDSDNDLLQTLRVERDRLKTENDGEIKCPVCGSVLSEEQKQVLLRKALDTIVAESKEVNDRISEYTRRIATWETALSEIEYVNIGNLKDELAELRKKDILPFAETKQGKALQADIDAVVIPEVRMPEDGELKQQVADIKEKLKGLYMKKGLQSRLSSLKNDIDELRIEQREKGAELAMYERRRQLVKDFKQEQMEILSHKVNDSLNCSSIDCWSQQKDGTMIPDLVLKNSEGVNFATANNASRLAVTADIQRFFCEKLDVNMPCFIDESSVFSSGNLPHFDGVQTFYLFCSDEPLKIESK